MIKNSSTYAQGKQSHVFGDTHAHTHTHTHTRTHTHTHTQAAYKGTSAQNAAS